MLEFETKTSGARFCDGITRRTWRRLGTLGTIGLSLPQWWSAQARGSELGAGSQVSRIKPTAKACIQIYLAGGPGQHETWDLKPDAPDGIRGEFRPIETSVA